MRCKNQELAIMIKLQMDSNTLCLLVFRTRDSLKKPSGTIAEKLSETKKDIKIFKGRLEILQSKQII